MAANPGLSLAQKQKLTLSTAMGQSLRLLRMSTQSLAEVIAREEEVNPFLVVDYPTGGPSAYEYALETTAAPEGVIESLHRQILLQRLDRATEAAALYLIGELREDGYLDTTLEELAASTGVPRTVLESGLHALQACEPAGVGARDLAECLELKLADAGIDRGLAQKAVQRLDDFAEGRWAQLVRGLGRDRAELERIAGLLRGFNSAPIEVDVERADALLPELAAAVDSHGRLSVSLVSGLLPSVSLMSVPRESLERDGLQGLYDRAGELVAGIAARQKTLLRIGVHIVETQSEFFLGQHETIKPVTRAEAAAALAVHPSTLGRAVAGKAITAGGKVYPLALFFSRALVGARGTLSPFDVQRRIRALIAAESTVAPLTDDRICALLSDEGVDIARRTVAKYRKCMRITSSFGRKRRKNSAQG